MLMLDIVGSSSSSSSSSSGILYVSMYLPRGHVEYSMDIGTPHSY